MRRLVSLCVLFAILVLGIAPARAQFGTGTLPGEFMGMVIRDPHYEWNTNPDYPDDVNRAFYDAMGQNLAAAGVKWVRFEFWADEVENFNPDNPLEGLPLEETDYFINVVAPRHDFKVLGLLASNLVRTERWIHPEEIERTDQEMPQCRTYKYGCFTNEYMRLWLDRAFAIAERYKGRVAAYEIMNEENRYISPEHSGRGISPQQMARLLTKFYRIFKLNKGPEGTFGDWREEVKIILGGLHPNRCQDCITFAGTPMTDREYLDAVYKSPSFAEFRNLPASGGRWPLDGVGYHPYPMEMRYGLLPEPSGASDLYRIPERTRDIRQVMVNNGDVQNKIWVTEIGDRGSPLDPDNMARQAQFMRSVYWMLWQQREYVQTVLWFKYEDFEVETGAGNWGIVTLLPRTPTVECRECQYEVNGAVQRYKDSFFAFGEMAATGAGLEAYRTYLPIVTR